MRDEEVTRMDMHRKRRADTRGPASSDARALEQLAAADGIDVDELLREVSEFRLALDVDLTVAAAAAEAADLDEAPATLPLDLTAQALESGHAGMVKLRRDVELGRSRAAHPSKRARRGPSAPVDRASTSKRSTRLRRIALAPTAPLVIVAVALGLGGGAFASHLGGDADGKSDAANSSLATLSSAVGQGNVSAAVAAGHQLQAAVAALIGQASKNPQAAHAAAQLLIAEQTVIASLPGASCQELRTAMQAQALQLQQVSGSSVTSLAVLPTSGASIRPTSVTLPPVLRSIIPSHPLAPLPLTSLVVVPTLPKPKLTALESLLPSLPAIKEPSAAPSAPSATTSPTPSPTATPSATPTSTPAATTTTQPAFSFPGTGPGNDSLFSPGP